jgi:putative phosphoribosyl transferase
MHTFRHRSDAGKYLATKLSHLQGRPDVAVLGLPRGGVPVAYEVADALHAPLDVFIVRKLGLPFHEELAVGAIASGGVTVLNDEVLAMYHVDREDLKRIVVKEMQELQRREQLYRKGRRLIELRGKIVVLVDDGLATGATMKAALAAVRKHNPARVIVAVPVGAYESCESLKYEADEVICAEIPPHFFAVGLWYQDFTQTTDDEVRELLERSAHAPPAHA